ncbi:MULTISPECIES: VOC family protein [unclassified Clostridium]|uniref:VOC family protein n=1 Tax=Clostridium sp. MCC328 TaxID=2592642 RepID=UPI0015F89FE1|nr:MULTISPECIES: VOC family protein [unclassified Clostridium]
MAIENCVTFLPCSDIKKTTHFYRDIVGLPVVQEQAGGMLKIFDTGYGYWGFCQYGDGRPIPSGDVGVCLSLNCHDEADVDRQYARMTEKGCVIKEPPKRQEKFPVYAFFTRDPDDYKVEFQRIQLEDQQLMGGRKE